MNPIKQLDLSGVWSFTPDGGESADITVPGGGWLKQGFSCEAGTYERLISIPDEDAVFMLEFGAVNHHASYYLGKPGEEMVKIYEEVTAFTPQTVNLTPYVIPGQDYILRVFVRAFENGRPIAPHCAEWCECIARGIFGYARLMVYPQIYISDMFVKTYTGKKQLSITLCITNRSKTERKIFLQADFSSWNGNDYAYPAIDGYEYVIKPDCTEVITIGPIDWILGPGSYWWPNVPYKPGYQAQLHMLTARLSEENKPLHTAKIRFGFREIRQAGPYYELNGVRINFRGDNLQTANYDRINHNGKGDAIHTLPGFLPPSEGNPGWPQAVDNFLRLNYNVQREHMIPWTPYMLDTCDEMGLMLIGESACRWEGFDMENGRGFHEVKCLEDIVRRDKNHPSIIRWSIKNEAQCLEEDYHVELYDSVKALDDTRPISEDIVVADFNAFNVDVIFRTLKEKDDFTWIDHYITYGPEGKPYFTSIEHNDAVIPKSDRPFGIGEANWMRSSTPVGLVWFATTTALARAQGASDVRPYVLLSSWASSVPGVKTTDLFTEEGRHPVYGEDNLPNPWLNPGITRLQKACSPFLAMDYDFWKANRKSNAMGYFPIEAPLVQADKPVNRVITVFNDDLQGEDLVLRWDVREGSPSNGVAERGEKSLVIKPGYNQAVEITFTAPAYNTFLFLTLIVEKNGIECFYDDCTCFEVTGGRDFVPIFNDEERVFI